MLLKVGRGKPWLGLKKKKKSTCEKHVAKDVRMPFTFITQKKTEV